MPTLPLRAGARGVCGGGEGGCAAEGEAQEDSHGMVPAVCAGGGEG